MKQLDLDPRRAVFPRRCVACGAAPTTAYTLELRGGLDLLVFAMQTCVDLEVPLCTRCGRRNTWRRAGWVAATLVVVVAVCSVVPILQMLFPEAHGVIAFVGAAVLFPGSFAALWWARNREDWLYHQWFSPIWVVAFDRTSMSARLGFHDASTWRDVGVLSGVLPPSEGAEESGYRDHAAPIPAPFAPAEPPLAWWPPVLLGLGVIAGGVADFLGLLGPHRRSSGLTQVLNDLLDALVGPTGALVLWLVVGLVFVALGFLLRRVQKTGHGE
jgi:hypothetical protein